MTINCFQIPHLAAEYNPRILLLYYLPDVMFYYKKNGFEPNVQNFNLGPCHFRFYLKDEYGRSAKVDLLI